MAPGGPQAELPLADDTRRPTLEAQIEFLKTTDMAVVISSQQNEVDEFKKRGIDIKPHRER
ncbi:MAG: hypothetical protein ACK5WR_02325, partial [Planctomycetaceae bacterium]